MKRLYVIPEYRGKKIGNALIKHVIREAKLSGYEQMRLDTLASMKEANALYIAFGFRPIRAYRYNPLSQPIYYELQLL